MITSENLKQILQSLDKEQIEQAINGDGDYIVFELHVFNAGAYATVESSHYDEEKEEDLSANGNLFLDKDDFLRLFDECGLYEIVQDY